MKKKKPSVFPALKKGWELGEPRILDTSPLPVRQGTQSTFPALAAVLQAIHLHKLKRATFQAQSNLNPLPTGMLFLARDLPKEATSAKPLPCEVRGKLRQLSSSAPALRSKQGIYRRLRINLSPFPNSPTASARSNRV